eukprot:scaffold73582_cov15-Tisochrysis_lutea.AAC.1
MYHKDSDTPFACRTTSLNEDLGQVRRSLCILSCTNMCAHTPPAHVGTCPHSSLTICAHLRRRLVEGFTPLEDTGVCAYSPSTYQLKCVCTSPPDQTSWDALAAFTDGNLCQCAGRLHVLGQPTSMQTTQKRMNDDMCMHGNLHGCEGSSA